MKRNNKFKATCISSLILLSMTFSIAQAAAFSDVPAENKYYGAISEISELGIVTGYEDGTFKPDEYITKAELSAMIARMTPYDAFDSTQYPQLFTDVTPEHWAYSYINKAAYCGVFSTFENTEYSDTYLGTTAVTVPNIESDIFSPESYVTYAEAVKAVTTLLGYNGIAERNGGSPEGYLFAAKVFGFTDSVSGYTADEYITRADLSLIASNALDIHWCIEGSPETENMLSKDNIPYIKYDGYIIYAGLNENTLRDIITNDEMNNLSN